MKQWSEGIRLVLIYLVPFNSKLCSISQNFSVHILKITLNKIIHKIIHNRIFFDFIIHNLDTPLKHSTHFLGVAFICHYSVICLMGSINCHYLLDGPNQLIDPTLLIYADTADWGANVCPLEWTWEHFSLNLRVQSGKLRRSPPKHPGFSYIPANCKLAPVHTTMFCITLSAATLLIPHSHICTKGRVYDVEREGAKRRREDEV